MRQFISFFTVVTILICSTFLQVNINSVFAQGSYWSEVSLRSDDGNPTIQPAEYRTVGLDIEAIRQVLDSAPHEKDASARNSSAVIELPMPDGTMEMFSFVNSPVMAPELVVKYPEIQVFLGQGIDNPSSTVRFDLTPQGFHAMILSTKSTVYIDPYSSGDLTKCISYTKNSFYEATDKQHGGCIVEDGHLEGVTPKSQNPIMTPKTSDSKPQVLQMGLQKSMMVSNGSTLRTYRLALACTGEYAQYHGGTIAGALAAMNTSMARVNGVFERDVCIRMIIVANNESVIFLDSGSDPYSNGNGSTMLSQNQSTCDSNIGSNNYDIGHVFSTGGGGVAYLQSPCGGNKAGGVTGHNSPANDPFDIDYVAHEMGHQWGANHTQNNSCNRSSGAAFEPGSASTIMGYAGICSPNLQSNSDDHFHNHSINEMIAFTNGSGNSCASSSATNNNIPTVSTMGGGSTIPANTPFELIASGSDSDSDPITYNWEEYDLGPSTASGDNNLTNPSGNQPIFRSWSSSTSNTRVFPRISDLVNGTTTIGEHLPTYSRGLQFKCSVRDNRAGGGAFTDELMSIAVDGNSGPFVLTSPNNGSVPNGFANITWNVAGTDQAPVNCTTVAIYLSTDGGYSFPTLLASGVANSGSATVLIPALTTTTARFKIKGEGNVFFDISDSNVTITQGVGGADWDIAVQGVSGLNSAGCGTAVSPSITIVNLGIQTITNFSVTYSLNGVWEGLNDSPGGYLASGESVDIALCPQGDACVDLGNGTHTIDVSVVLDSSNGIDEDLANNQSSTQFTTLGGAEVTLSLLTDSYPGETTWTVTDAEGLVVWSGGPYGSPETSYIETTCLTFGCYTLSVMDSYGDGLTYGGVTGNYELVDAIGTVLAQIVEGGNFGSQADHEFCLESQGISGCTDPESPNYNPEATIDDGSCFTPMPGCTDINACNYDPLANEDDGSCTYPPGPLFDCAGNCLFDADNDGICDQNEIPGCSDPEACNYNSLATDPGDCIYPQEGYDCDGVPLCPLDLNNNGAIEVSDLLIILSDFGCSSNCIGDVNGDGVVTVSDVLNLLSSFGDSCP